MNFAAHGRPIGLPGEPEWTPYGSGDRGVLVIDKQDRVVDDVDRDIRLAWGDQILGFR